MSGEDPLEKGMAIHSSVLAWRIPRTEEPGGLQSLGSHRFAHDLATSRLHTGLESQSKLLNLGTIIFQWQDAGE